MNTPAQKPSPEFIRGGRLRKTSKGLISFAPFLAGASVLALGALLATSSPVQAGNCTEEPMGSGMWICSGAANSNDVPFVRVIGAGQSTTFTDTDDFGLSVSGNASNIGNRGFYIRTAQESHSLTFDLDGDITAEENAFDIGPSSITGALTITTRGAITSNNQKGIFVDTAMETTGDVTITSHGDITAGGQAIHVQQDGSGAVIIETNGSVLAGVGTGGIHVQQNGAGRVSVTTNGALDAMNVSAGIYVETATVTEGDVEIELNGNISPLGPNGAAIHVKNLGSGAVAIRANANVETQASGIYVDQDGTNSVTVTSTGGTLDVEGSGIRVVTVAETMGSVLIESRSNIISTPGGTAEGIFVNQRGVGAVTIITDGTVNSTGEAGIRVRTADGVTTGDVGITVNNDVTGGIGIDVDNQGSGDVTINVNAEVASSSSSGTAIDLNGKGTHTIILGTGASIMGAIDAETGVTANIEVAGDVRDFNFGNLGAGIDNFTVSENAVLSVMGAQSWSGAVTLSGRLAITGDHPIRETGSTFSVASLAGDGVIDIDVDFSNGDMTFSEPRISATSATGSITVNIRSRGEFPEISEEDEDEAIRIDNIFQVTGNADADAFVAGRALSRGFRFQLAHDDSSGANRWAIIAVEAGGIEEAIYESLPAALGQLAGLESYRQRLQGRRHGSNGGVWAKVSSESSDFEPASVALATYEVKNAVVEFGIDVPFRINYPHVPDNFTVGASVAFGDATTDVAFEDDAGEIATESIKAGVSANWEYGGIYADGQLQYATFGNEIGTDMKIADETATAYSAGLEVGYGMGIGNLRVIPAAQLLWTSVDFGTFTDNENLQVVLDDGVVLTGRTGIGVEYDWDGVLYRGVPAANILLRGHADVLMPLDGKVGTTVSGIELFSEAESPAFDIGVGATYAWSDVVAIFADISTRQGGEVEGYAGSTGFKYKF